MRKLFFLAATVFFLLTISTASYAQFVFPVEVREDVKFDTEKYIDRLWSVLFSVDVVAKHPEMKFVEQLYKLIGLDTLKAEESHLTIGDGRIHCTSAASLKPGANTGLIAKIVNMPDVQFKVGDVFSPGETILALSIAHPGDKVMGVLKELEESKIFENIPIPKGAKGPNPAQIAEMIPMFMQMFGGEDAVQQALGEEVDVLVLSVPGKLLRAKEKPLVALMVTVAPGVNAKAAADPFLKMGNVDTTKAVFAGRGLTFYPLSKGGAAVGLSDKSYVLVSNLDDAKALFSTSPEEHLALTSGNVYFRLDIDKVQKIVDANKEAVLKAMPELPLDMLDQLFDMSGGGFGAVECVTRHDGGKMTCELTANQRVLNAGAYYMTLAVGAIATEAAKQHPKIEFKPGVKGGEQEPGESDERKAALSAGIADVKSALGSYAAEHNGLFPKKADELIEGGYLQEWPDNAYVPGHKMTPEPPSTFMAGDFVYAPIIDGGNAVGFWLFGFGMDQHGGLDVFGPKSTSAFTHFVPEEDGIPDGVLVVTGENVPADYEHFLTE